MELCQPDPTLHAPKHAPATPKCCESTRGPSEEILLDLCSRTFVSKSAGATLFGQYYRFWIIQAKPPQTQSELHQRHVNVVRRVEVSVITIPTPKQQPPYENIVFQKKCIAAAALMPLNCGPLIVYRLG